MAKVPASITQPSNTFWKSQAWDPDVSPKTLEWHEPDPFAPIPASVYEDATKKKELAFLKLKQLMADGLEAHEKLLYGAQGPLPGVIVHDCSEYVPHGTVLLDSLQYLVNQWTPGHTEPKYIGVGKGDLARYLLSVSVHHISNFYGEVPTYKGIRVIEHDHRAGYYLLVCY